jgi:pimeloyl-ACP methyl ester carboxylesterase
VKLVWLLLTKETADNVKGNIHFGDTMARPRRPLLIGLLATVGALTGGVWVVSRHAINRGEDLQLESVEKPGSVFYVRGTGIHFIEAGEGTPVVLIHGFGGSTFSFRYLLPALAQKFRAIALDLKGFGYSERPVDTDYSETGQARMVHDFLEQMGIEKAILVGHQMGGAIALRLAAKWPEMVERLVVVTAPPERSSAPAARVVRPFVPLVAAVTFQNPILRKRLFRGAVYDADFLTDEVLQGYFLPFRIRGSIKALGKMMVDRAKDPPIDYDAVKQPVLLLWSDNDQWAMVENGERLRSLLADAELTVLPDGGHLLLEGKPEKANRAILEFLGVPEKRSAEGV